MTETQKTKEPFDKELRELAASAPDIIPMTLKRESWEQIFLSLGELGLGQMSRERHNHLSDRGIYFSNGGFWAAIQELHRQYQEMTGKPPKTQH